MERKSIKKHKSDLNEQLLEKTKTGNAPEDNINSELHKYMPKELKLELLKRLNEDKLHRVKSFLRSDLSLSHSRNSQHFNMV
jgi:hypothetical protein